jgi:plastocyanin
MRFASRSTGVLFLALSAFACGGEDSQAPAPPPPAPVGKITLANFSFRSDRNGSSNPAVDTVPAGTTVTWKWGSTGTTPHTVQSKSTPGFVSSAELVGFGSTVNVTFPTAGTFQYDCALHPGMTGRIVVQ